MKITHDRQGDAVRIILNDRQPCKNHVIHEGLIIRVDENDQIVSISILDAALNVPEPDKLEYVDITRPEYDQRRQTG